MREKEFYCTECAGDFTTGTELKLHDCQTVKIEKNNIQEMVLEFMKDLKSKATVNILDLEKFTNMGYNIERSIEDLIKSRANHRMKYKEAKLEIKELKREIKYLQKEIKKSTKKKDPRTMRNCDPEEGTSGRRWGRKVE